MSTIQVILIILFLLLLSCCPWALKERRRAITALKKERQKGEAQLKLLTREDRLSELGSMMGNIAHQWKQPLNNIALLVLNIQNSHRKNQLTSEYLEDKVFAIEETIEYMSQTIEDFSDYLSPTKEKQTFYLNDSVEKAIELTSPVLNRAKVDIIFLADDDFEYWGQKNELTQLLIILINNAKDALEKDTKNNEKAIEVNLTKEEHALILTVEDNGRGIPAELLEKIWEPYFTTNSDTKGRGLGLYMAKTLIEGLEGTIEVSNRKGACFKLSFPLT